MKKHGQYLVFVLDGHLFGIPLSQVARVVRSVECTPLRQAPSSVLGVIDFHGDVLPLLCLRARFGLAERGVDVGDQFVIAIARERTVALRVDQVKGIIKRDAEHLMSVESITPGVEQIDGVIQLEDGLTVIQDLDRVLSMHEDRALCEALMEQR